MPHTASTQDLDELLALFEQGNRSALAKVLTYLETGRASDLPALVSALTARAKGAQLIGITGPPGAGKSTLVNALTQAYRNAGSTVAVIAVDPSSPLSGGAILGDRIRMTTAVDDPGVFVRSLASGGHLGGITPAAVRIIDGLDAAGYDVILIETVGTGQNEVDIARVADVRVVVAAPGLGDGIQAMKAGLLEIADVLVVNKADRPGAQATREQLASALSLRSDGSEIPVLATVAATGDGVGALRLAIADAWDAKAAGTAPQQRRARRARYLLARTLSDVVSRRLSDPARAETIDALANAVIDGRLDAETAISELIAPTPNRD